jgi:hypothetical protein
MSIFELYVRDEKEANSYRNRLREIKNGLEQDAVVKVIPESESNFRLPAIRTAHNVYEGELSVAQLLAHIAPR